MRCSEEAQRLLKELEGYVAEPYQDVAGRWVVGYGTRISDPDRDYSREEIEALFEEAVQRADKAVGQLVKVPLKQHQFDALVLFVYNIGEDAFAQSSMLRFVNQGDFRKAAREFLRWVYADQKVLAGLLERRYRERLVFEYGMYV